MTSQLRPAEKLLLTILAALVLGIAAAPLLADRAALMQLDLRFHPPGAGALLGTDQLGRDIAARVLGGAPWSLGVAGGATLIALVLGTVAGLAAAELEGWPRRVILQLVTLVLSFPGLVAAVAAVAVLGQSGLSVLLVLGLLTWTLFARVIYAEASSVRSRDYVTAARLGGVGRARLLARHVLPAIAPSLIAMMVFHFADMLVASSALSFLGVGAPLGAPAWGALLAESRPYIYQAPWMLLGPATALAGTVLLLNLLGDLVARRLGLSGRPA
ncbi:ABC transporter permease [Polymorphobacter sp.]|uniref:ABC transporter permease n=1 Tax=Polymorphobacter sp. TaxID=1909290 RepID=UPI003F70174C